MMAGFGALRFRISRSTFYKWLFLHLWPALRFFSCLAGVLRVGFKSHNRNQNNFLSRNYPTSCLSDWKQHYIKCISVSAEIPESPKNHVNMEENLRQYLRNSHIFKKCDPQIQKEYLGHYNIQENIHSVICTYTLSFCLYNAKKLAIFQILNRDQLIKDAIHTVQN